MTDPLKHNFGDFDELDVAIFKFPENFDTEKFKIGRKLKIFFFFCIFWTGMLAQANINGRFAAVCIG